MSNVTALDLSRGFLDLGIMPGMNLIVHSSIRSFGYVEGGADAVIDALIAAISPRGTLVMPSFNHGAPYKKGEVFDIRHTPTTNGNIPDTFWRRPGVMRSMNPTHPFAAYGENAYRYTHTAPHGDIIDSPFGLMLDDGGYCLLLGVGYTSNTFHHYVEYVNNAPCLRLRGERYPVIDANGQPTDAYTWSYRGGKCPFDDPALYARDMRAHDSRVMIGSCEAILYKLSDGFEVISQYLAQGADGFPPCTGCAVKPWVNEFTVG